MTTKEIKFNKNIERNIFFIKQFENLGISKRYTGFYLLIEIMQILINEERRIVSFSKEVYPMIAEKYGKTDCTIERNIRSLIEKCWTFELMEKLNTYYP